jgi:hypothetical protein
MPATPFLPHTTATFKRLTLHLALALAAPLAAAQSDSARPIDPDSGVEVPGEPPPLWTAGLFFVAADHAAYPGAEERKRDATLLPFITWRGQILRVVSGAAGLRTLRTPRAEMDFSAAASFGSSGTDSGAREGMPAIGTLVEIGPSLRINLGELREDGERPPWRLDLPVRAVFDASRDLDFAGLSFEPRLNWRLYPVGEWVPTLYASLLFGNHALNSMYYGVAPVYATPTRPAYEAHSGLVATRLGTSFARMIGRDWRLALHASVETVRGAVNADSPVIGRSVDPTVAISITWTALRSAEAGVE